jgi:hypothetical protein
MGIYQRLHIPVECGPDVDPRSFPPEETSECDQQILSVDPVHIQDEATNGLLSLHGGDMPDDPVGVCINTSGAAQKSVERGSCCELGVVDPFEGFGGGVAVLDEREHSGDKVVA